jgi:spore coat protein CotH
MKLVGGLLAVCLASQVTSAAASAQTQDALFSDAVLQDVRLAISSRDWETLKARASEDTYYPADVIWNGVTVRNVGIRSRGASTRNGIKPGLRVDINHYVASQEFLGLKAFVLDNMYSDDSLVRESVTMKMFAKMAFPAPREAHARLFVNNEYVGVYVLSESIDRTFIGRVFGAAEANVENGGYLLEFEHVAPYHFEYLGPDLLAYAGLFKPQTRDTDSAVNVYGPLVDMIRTINESSDEDFAAAVGRYLDLQQIVKYVAIEEFIVEWDGLVGFAGMNNFYLYRSWQTGQSQLIPKDKDAALASANDSILLRVDTNVLVRRALNVPELRQAFLEALLSCAAFADEPGVDDPRGWLEREADGETRQIAQAVSEDPVYPASFEEFEATVDQLLDFARTRSAVVRAQLADLPATP